MVLIIPREEQSISYDLIENKNAGELELKDFSGKKASEDEEEYFSDLQPEDKDVPAAAAPNEEGPDASEPEAEKSATEEPD